MLATSTPTRISSLKKTNLSTKSDQKINYSPILPPHLAHLPMNVPSRPSLSAKLKESNKSKLISPLNPVQQFKKISKNQNSNNENIKKVTD